MNESNPHITQSDSVQIGDNAIGPSTGDIVINSGSNIMHCSMCNTPIDAQNNPGLYCFKEGCNTLFCSNCESFFRAKREPGEKPYCADHIAEFVGPNTPPEPTGFNSQEQEANVQQNMNQPEPVLINQQLNQMQPVQIVQQPQPVSMYQYAQIGTHGAPQGMHNLHHNPYINQMMIDPVTAFVRTIKSWSGEGRAQRSEYWWGTLGYIFLLAMIATILPFFIALMFLDSNQGLGAASGFGLLIGILSFALIVFFIPVLSQTIRRLHDSGNTGWWVFLGLIPYIGPLALLIFCVLPSQPHQNKYG